MNKALLGGLFVKTRLADYVYVNGRMLNVLPRTLVLDIVKTVYLLLVYLLAHPRLAEAHDFSTVVPLTGAARSTPKPLPISNLLHSQHLSNDWHKDVMNKPLIKNRLASFVYETPATPSAA